MCLCRISSAGQSTCLTSMGSTVRICYPVPLQGATAQICNKFMLSAQYTSMVSIAQRKSAGLWLRRSRFQNSLLTPNGRVAEWFKAPSWKGGEGNTSASSNLVSSSKETYIGSRGNGERRAIQFQMLQYKYPFPPYGGVAQRRLQWSPKPSTKVHLGSSPSALAINSRNPR